MNTLYRIMKEIHQLERMNLEVLMKMKEELRITGQISTSERRDLIVIIEKEIEKQNLEGFIVVGAVNVITKSKIRKSGIIKKKKNKNKVSKNF